MRVANAVSATGIYMTFQAFRNTRVSHLAMARLPEIAGGALAKKARAATYRNAKDVILTTSRREETIESVPRALTEIFQKQTKTSGSGGLSRSAPARVMIQVQKTTAFDISAMRVSVMGGSTQARVSVHVDDARVARPCGAIVQAGNHPIPAAWLAVRRARQVAP
jgi:hypothetical protein